MTSPFADADERIHPVDPDDWSWNESWYFSWIDLDGGPAGFFRVGVLPNQRRAMLWCFVHVDGNWLGIEESRLAFDDLDLTDGVAYDRWALQFAWQPSPPLSGARVRVPRQPAGAQRRGRGRTCAGLRRPHVRIHERSRWDGHR